MVEAYVPTYVLPWWTSVPKSATLLNEVQYLIFAGGLCTSSYSTYLGDGTDPSWCNSWLQGPCSLLFCSVLLLLLRRRRRRLLLLSTTTKHCYCRVSVVHDRIVADGDRETGASQPIIPDFHLASSSFFHLQEIHHLFHNHPRQRRHELYGF